MMKFMILMLLYPPLGHTGSISVIQGFETMMACEVAQDEMKKATPTSSTKCVKLPANQAAAMSMVPQ